MADKKITELAEDILPQPDDFIATVDVSDTTESPEGSNKKVTLDNLRAGRNVEADGQKLDSIEWGAEQNKVNSVNGKDGDVVLSISDIEYDNSTSGLEATNGQAAIDELAARDGGSLPADDVSFDNSREGILSSTTVQGAIDELSQSSGGGGGQSLYDCIVDAAGGGDYTLLSAAVSAGKQNIFVRAGTYTEPSQITIGYGVTITGESKFNTIIAFSAYNTGFVFSSSNSSLHNLTIAPTIGPHNSGFPSITVDGDKCELDNIYYTLANATIGAGVAVLLVRGNMFHMHDCLIENLTNPGNQSPIQFSNSYSGSDASITNNVFRYFSGNSQNGFIYSAMETVLFTGNIFHLINANSNTSVFLYAVASNGCVISGNVFRSDNSSNQGALKLAGSNPVVTGNAIVGFATSITDSSTGSVIGNNYAP